MASESIFNATIENFESDVLEASFDTPVLVDFWAPWCGPCRMLMPLLDKIVGSYNGTLKLAKVNTDEQGEIAGSFGIRSLPTVVLIKDGKPVDGFMGAQPEGAIRALLAKHMPAIDVAAEEPEDVAQPELNVDLDQAIAEARAEVADNDSEEAPKAKLADLLIRSGAMAEAEALLEGLSESGRETAEASRALARLAFARIASASPGEQALLQTLASDANNLGARHQLGAVLLCSGREEAALQQFLQILKSDRKFEDDLGRRALVEAFSVVDDDALVGDYRRRMSTLLF